MAVRVTLNNSVKRAKSRRQTFIYNLADRDRGAADLHTLICMQQPVQDDNVCLFRIIPPTVSCEGICMFLWRDSRDEKRKMESHRDTEHGR